MCRRIKVSVLMICLMQVLAPSNKAFATGPELAATWPVFLVDTLERDAISGLPLVRLKTPQSVLDVEIAQTAKARRKGLMGRKHLPAHQGMFFIYAYDGRLNFWMKDTHVALDMVFIDKDGVIVNILHAKPCRHDPCRIYSSAKPARYVLEIAYQQARMLGLHVGYQF